MHNRSCRYSSLATSVTRTYACASVLEELRNENAALAVIIFSGSWHLLIYAFQPRPSEDRRELGQGRTDVANFADFAGGRQSAAASRDRSQHECLQGRARSGR